MILLTTTIALLVVFLLYYIKKKHGYPPGPPGLPFVGNAFQFKKKGINNQVCEWAQQYGDVYSLKMFGADYIVLNSYETIYEALVTKGNDFAGRTQNYRMDLFRNFSDDIVFSSYSNKWAFMKKLVMSTLKMYGNNLENLEVISVDLIQDMMRELEEKVRLGESVDMFPVMHRCTTGIITSILYGVKIKAEDVDKLLSTSEKSGEDLSRTGPNMALDIWPWMRFFPLRGLYKRIIEARKINEDWFNKEIAKTKTRYEPGNPRCLLDGLFEYQRTSAMKPAENKISDQDIHGINTNMIFAGTLTTSLSLYIFVSVLVTRQAIQEKMAAEILTEIGERRPSLKDRTKLCYVEASILELLRFSTILPLNLPHTTMVDTTIGGFRIPKNTSVSKG